MRARLAWLHCGHAAVRLPASSNDSFTVNATQPLAGGAPREPPRSAPPTRPPYWPTVLILASGLLLTAMVDALDRRALEGLWRARAVAAAEQIGQELRTRVLSERSPLVAAATLYFGSEEVTDAELEEAAEVIRRSRGRQTRPRLAWVSAANGEGMRVAQSTDRDGLLAEGRDLDGPEGVLRSVALARQSAPALQIGELFEHEGGMLLALIDFDQLVGDLVADAFRPGMALQVIHPLHPGIDRARLPGLGGPAVFAHRQTIGLGAFEWALHWEFDRRLLPPNERLRSGFIWIAGAMVALSLALLFHSLLSRKFVVERRLREQRQQLEATFAELHSAMKLVAAQERMAALGQLVAGVAHELNTPIGIALLAASGIADRQDDIEADLDANRLRQTALREYLVASREAARLVELSLHKAAALLHDFKQIAVDRASERRRRFDLATSVQELCALMAPQLRGSGHRLIQEVPEGITVDSFPGPLGQILSNLVTNSLRHGLRPEVPGTMRISAERVGNDEVEIRYSDDGTGIDPGIRERIFDPFFTTRLGEGGSGLGMHIARNLARDVLGGDLRCEAAERGTCFVLRLPLRAPESASPRQDAPSGRPSEG